MSEWFPTFRSFGQTLRHTPMRDLIRLQLSGRLNWRARIAESDLPEAVQEKITDVVKATRLWRLEKSQITNELIAHFGDAQDRGRSFEQVLNGFGETKTVAAMMQSAKKRNRSIFWKTFVVGSYALFAALIFYAGLAAWFCSIKPNPSTDYIAWFGVNARAVPLEDQAWPIYRQAWIDHDWIETSIADRVDPDAAAAKSDWYEWSPGDEKWPQLAQFLKDHDSLISAFRKGGQKSGLGLEVKLSKDYAEEDLQALFGEDRRPSDELGVAGWSSETEKLFADTALGVLLPHAQEFRRMTWLLAADSKLASEQGDSQRVTDNYLAMLGMGPQVSESPVLVCALVGVAIDSISYRALQEQLEQYPELLDDQQLAAIQDKINRKTPRSYLQLKGERAFQMDMIQRIYSDDGNGDGRLTSQAYNAIAVIEGLTKMVGSERDDGTRAAILLGGPGLSLIGSSRKQVEAAFDTLNDKMEEGIGKPLYATVPADDSDIVALMNEHANGDPFCHYLMGALIPATYQVKFAVERSEAQRSAAELAVAAYRYRLANDKFPETARQLIPNFIQAIPLDVITGKPLQYRIADGKPLIYSVGGDGVDDGGVAAIASHHSDQDLMHANDHLQQVFGEPALDTVDGDWILWPDNDRK